MDKERTITISKVHTRIEWLMSPVGLLIDEVVFDGGPFSIETKDLKSSTGSGTFVAKVREKSIEVFLEKLNPGGLSEFIVSVASDGIHIKATKRVLIPIPATAHAKLKLDSASSLSIELISAEAAGAGLKNLVAGQLAQMNPIVEAEMFPFPVEFTEIQHHEGAVVILGTATLQ